MLDVSCNVQLAPADISLRARLLLPALPVLPALDVLDGVQRVHVDVL